MRPQRGDPNFSELWKRFQLKVHPDLFMRWPDLHKTNTESLQKLQGILNECKSGERSVTEYLRPRVETMEFYMRTDKENAFMRVPVSIRIPGANCRNVLATSFAALFKQAGLPARFHWGPEYWNQTYTVPPPAPGEEEEPEAEGRRMYS
jgi:hypothetical protein